MNRIHLIAGLCLISACTAPEGNGSSEELTADIENPTTRVVLSSDIVWEKLNPARGDKSPQAGTVWGDRKGTVATGFLAKFVDGFSSPPHIHNVTYRAVVIKGLVHNDDSQASTMWMPPGSFWTQPIGEAHITSARGTENIAYVEIDRGPYLVKPTEEAFDNGERPINVDASNVVWLDHSRTSWVSAESGAELSFLWDSKKEDGLKGVFVKLPVGFRGKMRSDGQVFHAIVIQGSVSYQLPQEAQEIMLDPTSYFGSEGQSLHTLESAENQPVILYIRTNGQIKVE
ncbi:MAG TPA: hypothetical protein DCE41_19335 [Cytophagales bacterium]|nr:hypothetical protein [Cytophagales bacterium]